jgi:hypothetical protein
MYMYTINVVAIATCVSGRLTDRGMADYSLELMTVTDITLWLEQKGFPASVQNSFRGKLHGLLGPGGLHCCTLL